MQGRQPTFQTPHAQRKNVNVSSTMSLTEASLDIRAYNETRRPVADYHTIRQCFREFLTKFECHPATNGTNSLCDLRGLAPLAPVEGRPLREEFIE
jgi:hypothetical protein